MREDFKEELEEAKQAVLVSETDGRVQIKWDTYSVREAINLLRGAISHLESMNKDEEKKKQKKEFLN